MSSRRARRDADHRNDHDSWHQANFDRFGDFVGNSTLNSHPSRQSAHGSISSSRTVHVPGTKGYEEYEEYERSDDGAYHGDRCFSRTESDRQGSLVDIRQHPGQKRRRARGGPPDTEDYDSNGRASYNDFDEYDGSGFHTEYRGQSPGVKPNVQTSPQASHRTETLNGYGDTFSSEDTDWQGSLHDFRNHPGQKSRHNGSRSPDDDAYGPTGRGNDGGLYDSDFGGYEASNYDNNEYRAGGSRWMPGDQARPHAAERGYEYAGTEEQATGGNGAGQRNEAPPQPGRITYPGYEQRG